jgi:hypothetical protein
MKSVGACPGEPGFAADGATSAVDGDGAVETVGIGRPVAFISF